MLQAFKLCYVIWKKFSLPHLCVRLAQARVLCTCSRRAIWRIPAIPEICKINAWTHECKECKLVLVSSLDSQHLTNSKLDCTMSPSWSKGLPRWIDFRKLPQCASAITGFQDCSQKSGAMCPRKPNRNKCLHFKFTGGPYVDEKLNKGFKGLIILYRKILYLRLLCRFLHQCAQVSTLQEAATVLDDPSNLVTCFCLETSLFVHKSQRSWVDTSHAPCLGDELPNVLVELLKASPNPQTRNDWPKLFELLLYIIYIWETLQKQIRSGGAATGLKRTWLVTSLLHLKSQDILYSRMQLH